MNRKCFLSKVKEISTFAAFSLFTQFTFADVGNSSSRSVDYDWAIQSGYGHYDQFLFLAGSSHMVEIKGAQSLRLNFKDVKLSDQSFIEIYSLKDGHTQILDQETLRQANFSSAYFNGDKVAVVLHAPEDDYDSSLAIDAVEVEDENDVAIESICGSSDNRYLSNDAAVGRVMPIGCTGWIIGNGKLVSAGHCFSSTTREANTVQFNVPISNPDGSKNHPGPEDQYTIIKSSIKYGHTEIGNDWAVFDVENNAVTGLQPINAQGKSFELVRQSSANTIRITGYGGDSGSRNQSQQTHTGAFRGREGPVLRYSVDTKGGNSGSPVIDNDTGRAIGVHTNAGCGVNGGANHGTSTFNNAFWNAANVGGIRPISGRLGPFNLESKKWRFWTLNVGPGVSNILHQTLKGSGDVDLYMRFGAKPTTATFDCRSWNSTNKEICNIENPAQGTWHIGVFGYRASSNWVLDYAIK